MSSCFFTSLNQVAHVVAGMNRAVVQERIIVDKTAISAFFMIAGAGGMKPCR